MEEILHEMRNAGGGDYFASGIKRAYCEKDNTTMSNWLKNDYKTDVVCVEDILKVDDEIIELEFYDEIDCDDLFATNDPRERIMVFRLC
jgi:hypothetical protein